MRGFFLFLVVAFAIYKLAKWLKRRAAEDEARRAAWAEFSTDELTPPARSLPARIPAPVAPPARPCPVCEHPLEGPPVPCPACGRAHHPECLELNDGCGACGWRTPGAR
jgi:rubrerythrin